MNHMTCYNSSALIGWYYSIQTEDKSCKVFFWKINFPPIRAVEFITGHVTYNPAYTFQLKTTKEIISSCTFFWLLFKITCLENSILSSTSCHLSCLRLKLPLLPLVPPLRAFHNQNQDQNQDLEVGNPGRKIRITAGDNVIINSLFVIFQICCVWKGVKPLRFSRLLYSCEF